MKKIKAVVLKDATKLTNKEMKEIRGGYEPERSSICSVQCTNGFAEKNCLIYPGTYCDVYSGVGFYGVGCFLDNDFVFGSEVLCPSEPVPTKNNTNNDI